MTNFHQKLNLSLAQKTYELYKLFFDYLRNFPKKERYSLGQKIENIVLNILEEIFLINSLPKTIKEPAFQNLNAKNELLKLLIRLCFELNLIGSNQYLIFEEKIQEIGKMIGGWIKYVRNE